MKAKVIRNHKDDNKWWDRCIGKIYPVLNEGDIKNPKNNVVVLAVGEDARDEQGLKIDIRCWNRDEVEIIEEKEK